MAVHVGLLLAFTFMTMASEPPPLGFVEVEFGSIAPGRPTDQSMNQNPQPSPPAPEPEPEQPVEEVTEPKTEPKTPVELPEQAPEEPEDEVIQEPEEEKTIPPEPQEEQPEEPAEEPTPEEPAEEEPQPLGQGDPEGTSGAPNSDEGTGDTDERTAPFSIEGLNRDPQRAPLPNYVEKVNAVIRMKITVGPNGRVVRSTPVRKANPELELAVMRTLRNWKFNELPPGVPQENQEGTITFRFRLE